MCDCENPILYTEKIVKARKPQKCEECRRLIEVGEQYQKIKGLWDGDFQEFETCLECSEKRVQVERLIECCVPFGELRDYMREIRFEEAL